MFLAQRQQKVKHKFTVISSYILRQAHSHTEQARSGGTAKPIARPRHSIVFLSWSQEVEQFSWPRLISPRGELSSCPINEKPEEASLNQPRSSFFPHTACLAASGGRGAFPFLKWPASFRAPLTFLPVHVWILRISRQESLTLRHLR